MAARLGWIVGMVLLAASGAASAYCVANTACDSLYDLQRRVDNTMQRMQIEDRLRTLQAQQDRIRHRMEAEQNYSEAQVRMLQALQSVRGAGRGESSPGAAAGSPPHRSPTR